MENVELHDLGRSPYQPIWDLQTAIQQRLVAQKKAQRTDETVTLDKEVLLFVEHPHVYTLGKSGDKTHLLKGLTELPGIDASFVEVDRGGDITYHGPGQIVGYPILDLDRHFTDIHKYLRCLEEVIIRTCADYGIEAERIEGLTGVWVGCEKICAMGIRCSRWVTMHGFGFNINADLSYFDHIVPCGIREKGVTSIQKILGEPVSIDRMKQQLVDHFEEVFDVTITNDGSLHELNNEFSYIQDELSVKI